MVVHRVGGTVDVWVTVCVGSGGLFDCQVLQHESGGSGSHCNNRCVVSPAERRLERLLRRYDSHDIDETYLDLYIEQGPYLRAFASIHQRLDVEFEWMNTKARNGSTGHFNADNSRSLLDLIDELAELARSMEMAGKSLWVSPEYQRVLDGSKEWLVDSGGSPIPEGFTPVLVEKYDAVFGLADAAVVLADHSKVSLTLVGEGAYAVVHKFVDPNYGITFARKKLKRSADEREVERFRREYEIMKGLDFPYILQVYRYDESENSYTMEFCESTLEEYIKRRNNKKNFDFSVRRRIALQFLYGLNYLHVKGYCHRDLKSQEHPSSCLHRRCSHGEAVRFRTCEATGVRFHEDRNRDSRHHHRGPCPGQLQRVRTGQQHLCGRIRSVVHIQGSQAAHQRFLSAWRDNSEVLPF
jgi:hypothetical protein